MAAVLGVVPDVETEVEGGQLDARRVDHDQVGEQVGQGGDAAVCEWVSAIAIVYFRTRAVGGCRSSC